MIYLLNDMQFIKKFRDEEMEHHDIGIQHEAEQVINLFNFYLFIKL